MSLDLGCIKAIIFDFDGVVVNSEPFYEEAIVDVFHENNIVIPPEDWQDFKGMADKEFFPLMVTRYNFQGDPNILKEEIYTRMKLKLVKLNYIAGFRQFFDAIAQKYPVGLVTSTSRQHIQWLVENTQIEDLFDLKITATDVVNTKPHPEPFNRMAGLLAIEPSNIVVIEDSINGLKAAQRAGMQTIALLTTFSKKEVDFADATAGDYTALAELFSL
ncbi:MAG: HAD family hydrolase [Fidelibacterota bacterium]